jgi:hypothetical protein
MCFINELLKTIEEWNKYPIEDEWLFETFRERFVSRMSPIEAFQVIDDTISILIKLSDESTAIEVLQTIINLARQSDTTEVPPKLYEMKDIIANQFENMDVYARGKLDELYRYYRLA